MRHKIMKYMAILITVICAFQTYVFWGTEMGYAFLIALCGWLPNCFEPSKINTNS